MRTNLLREPNTSEHRRPDHELSQEERLLDEAVLRSELLASILENMEVWIDRLGNPACVKGIATGEESGTVTRGAAVFYRSLDGRECFSFFELHESGEWRTSDILTLRLYPNSIPDTQEAPTIGLAKTAACTDWMTAKPMDGVEWQDVSWVTGPPQPPRFYKLKPLVK
jgi:hypothetical protein